MNLERVKAIYTEIEKFEIALDPDPVSRGPRYLQGLIATCRNNLNAVSKLMLEVHQEKQYLDRDLRARDAAFQVNFDNLLANDERIRRLPNIEDRKSTAKVFLREEIGCIEALKSEIHDLEYVEKAVRHRHRELAATMNEIKLQKSLIQAEIHTGAMYGDERATPDGAGERSSPAGVSIDEAELDALFEAEVRDEKQKVAVAASVVSEPKAAPPSAVSPAGKVTEADVAAFLGAPDATGAVGSDFDDVFQNL